MRCASTDLGRQQYRGLLLTARRQWLISGHWSFLMGSLSPRFCELSARTQIDAGWKLKSPRSGWCSGQCQICSGTML